MPRSTYAATGATARPGALARARSAGRSPGMPLARAGRLRNGQGARAPPTGPIKGGGGRPAPTLLGPCPSRPGGVPGPPPAGAASFRAAAVCPAGCRHGVAGAPAAACALPQGFSRPGALHGLRAQLGPESGAPGPPSARAAWCPSLGAWWPAWGPSGARCRGLANRSRWGCCGSVLLALAGSVCGLGGVCPRLANMGLCPMPLVVQ